MAHPFRFQLASGRDAAAANRRCIGAALVVLGALACLLSCAITAGRFEPSAELRRLQQVHCPYPAATFAVFSDPHVYDSRFGVSGRTFQEHIAKDRKLLAESEQLFDAVVARIGELPVDFVLVCGDLTKDGELASHRLVAEKLSRLSAGGKPVFVIPGNHDIANAEALRFDAEGSQPVPTVSEAGFAEIYRPFGYGAALERDADSLSYVAEPVPGLWLLALDSCRWREQGERGDPITGGAIHPSTRRWIQQVLIDAKRQGKAVIAAMHHGVLEHYPHNQEFYGRYLVDDHAWMADMLSAHGVKLVFTGHFHAQDVTARTFTDPERTLYDIETGSTVTAPCPYRIVTIGTDRKAVVESRFIDAIATRPTGFQAFAADYVFNGTIRLADDTLRKYRVSRADRGRLNPQIARAYVTHLAGDEVRPETALQTGGLGLWTRVVAWTQQDLIEGWYTDLPPADNNLVIDLAE